MHLPAARDRLCLFRIHLHFQRIRIDIALRAHELACITPACAAPGFLVFDVHLLALVRMEENHALVIAVREGQPFERGKHAGPTASGIRIDGDHANMPSVQHWGPSADELPGKALIQIERYTR
jgi:hypothetical protein